MTALISAAVGLLGLCLSAGVDAGVEASVEGFPLPTDAELGVQLAAVAKQEVKPPKYASEVWGKVGLSDPLSQAMAAAKAGQSPGVIVQRLAKGQGVSPEAARALLALELTIARGGRYYTALAEEDAPRAEAWLGRLEDAAPGSVTVLGLLLSREYELAELKGGKDVLAQLDRGPRATATALRMARALGSGSSDGAAFAAYAAGRDPATVAQAVALTRADSGATGLMVHLAAALATKQRAEMREALILALFEQGQPALALELVRGLPAARQAALKGSPPLARPAVPNTPRQPPQLDPRMEIAAELIATGDPKGAGEWVAGVARRALPSVEDGEHDRTRACEWALQRETLARLLGEKPLDADPFLYAVTARHCSPSRAPWNALIAEVLAGTRYVHDARAHLWHRPESLQRAERKWEPALEGELPFLATAQARLKQGVRNGYQREETDLAALPVDPEDGEDPTPALVAARARLGAPPREGPFTEQPVPARTDRPDAGVGSGWEPVVLEDGERGPRGFWLLRVEQRGTDRVALALSHALDPTGEGSAGGYWWLESHDEGGHWETPLYLGLREQRPYRLAPRSETPLVADGKLRLEAIAQELDESSLTFPPLNVRFKGEPRKVLLVATLEALRRDTDQDGLTDLVEERLLLDPARADTDGDGLRDDRDPLPLLPALANGERVSVEAELTSAVLAELEGENVKPAAVMTVPVPPGDGATALDAVRFLAIPPSAARGLRISGLTLPLGYAERKLAFKRFGTFYPTSLSLLVNEKQDQALVVWSERWRGGEFFAQKQADGSWRLTSISEWIT